MTRMRLKFENAMMCTQAPLVERFLNVGVKKQLSGTMLRMIYIVA